LSERQNDLSWFWNSDLYRRLQGMSCTKKPNLLRLLFAVHDEVRLHTPLLGWLLDPKGDHGLGATPLTRFLSILEIDPAGAEHARIWRERSFAEHGRVDLMVELPDRCIVIENKLYAADQEAQLWRYQKVLDAQPVLPLASHLFYLTPDGCEPSPLSISAPVDSEETGILEAGSYQCISYQNEIHTWLSALLKKVPEESRVHHILTQYHEVLMEVIGMHSREEAIKELESSGLMDHIAKNQGDISALAKLTRSVFFLHAKLLEELVETIHDALIKEPRLKSVKPPDRWKELDWATYEGWAKGRAPSGYRFYRITGIQDDELKDVYLVVGLDAEDGFWVGLGRFRAGQHHEVPDDLNRFAHIEGATHNNWWLSWVTIRELNPANFDGYRGIGKLAIVGAGDKVVENVLKIWKEYLVAFG
tara:strand:- start:64179 stop:65432 length:1254 start_codon:yes stop_codon:yes gene_type:complete